MLNYKFPWALIEAVDWNKLRKINTAIKPIEYEFWKSS